MLEQFLFGGASPCFLIAACPSGVIKSVVHVVSKLVSTLILPKPSTVYKCADTISSIILRAGQPAKVGVSVTCTSFVSLISIPVTIPKSTKDIVGISGSFTLL